MRLSFADAITRGLIDRGQVPKDQLKKERKQDREGDEQTDLIALFEQQHPQFAHLLIHIPNGGSRKNAYEGYRLKRQGVKAGVSDLFLPVARGGFFGLWIEFKAEPPFDAAVSTSQKEWISEMLGQGYQACVRMGSNAALATLSAYLKLPPTRPMAQTD
jgi:hypothetical protein